MIKKVKILLNLPDNLRKEFKAKCGLIPYSVVIRVLMEKFIKGEIKL